MTDKKELTITKDKPERNLSAQTITPMTLIQQANESGASIEKMEQLFSLQLRWEENEARKAYHKAVAAFKSETINIVKDKKVGYTNKDGSFTGYTHATLGNIVQTIIPVMGKHGLSHSWELVQSGSEITVICRLSHELGHSTSVTMSAGKDDSGKKNAIQQVASTISYLERYTLLAITGLATADQDDDAQSSGTPGTDCVSEDQLHNIEALIAELGIEPDAICARVQVKTLPEIPAKYYDWVVTKLEAKRRG